MNLLKALSTLPTHGVFYFYYFIILFLFYFIIISLEVELWLQEISHLFLLPFLSHSARRLEQ